MQSISTANNPIAFFQHFFESGYNEFYNSFFNPDEMLKLVYEEYAINKENKIRQTAIYLEDKFTGEMYLHKEKTFFNESLTNLLKQQQFISLQFIDERLFQINKENQNYFAEFVSLRIIKLINNFKTITEPEEYTLIKNCLQELIFKVYTTYSYLTLKPKNLAILKIINNYRQSISKKPQFSFKMHEKYLINIDKLYNDLIGEYIHRDTALTTFKNAFNATDFQLTEHVLIKWTAKVKSTPSSRPLLIYFISELMNKGIIHLESDINSKIIGLFGDANGRRFNINNLRVSKSNMNHNKTTTWQKDLLIKIIQEFQSAILSLS